MSSTKLWAGLVLLFGAGVVAGMVGTSFYGNALRPKAEHGPVAQHERIMKRLTEELSLTARQQSDIEPVVTRAHVAILELRFSHQAEIEEILAKGMAELKTKLSPEQQAELDKMYGGLQKRWQTSRAYVEEQKKSLPPQ